MLIGYLKRISNIAATVRNVGNKAIDARVGAGSYEQTRDSGEFHVRAHNREALVSRQDTTWGKVWMLRGSSTDDRFLSPVSPRSLSRRGRPRKRSSVSPPAG